jgi:cysteine desulfuration protein SufE
VADLSAMDRSERIDYLISLSERFVEVPPTVATRPWPAAARVPGCESEVFAFVVPRPDRTLDIHFAVDNPQGLTAKAWAAILAEGLSGRPDEEILAIPTDVVYAVFGRELSMGKNLGLAAMLGTVQNLARAAREEL